MTLTVAATVGVGAPAVADPTAATSVSNPAGAVHPAATAAPAIPVAPDTPAAPEVEARPVKLTEAAADQCGGRLALGRVASCSTIVDQQQHQFTVTTTVDSDVLIGRLTQLSGEIVQAQVTDPGGSQVCFLSSYSTECQLGPAGRYTATVYIYYGTGTSSYLLSFESTKAPSACKTLPERFFSFASPGVSGTLRAGLAARCFTFDQPTGTVLHLADPSGTDDVQGSVRDAENQPAGCNVRYAQNCTLTGPGPYRLFLEETYGNEAPYNLRMPRISHAFGCPTLPLTGFGDPGPSGGSGTIPASEIGCQALTAAAPGTVAIRFDGFAAQRFYWYLYDVDGQQVCSQYENARSCALPQAGSYTLIARNNNWDPVVYQAAVTSLNGSDGCAPLTGTAWDPPAVVVSQTSPVQTNCQPFTAEAGDRIIVYGAPDRWNQLSTWLVDEQGTVLCTEWSEEDGCVLPNDGTYRVISYLSGWDSGTTELTYRLQIRALDDPSGCPTVTPGSYGTAPEAGLAGIRCRVLDIPAAGTYQVRAVNANNYRQYPTIYDASGLRVCSWQHCQFPAAGRYTLVLNGPEVNKVIDNDHLYTVSVLPVAPSNCATAADDGPSIEPFRDSFTAPGEVDCVELPSPAGARIVRWAPGDATGAARPEITIVDATGAYLCDYNSLYQYSCELTGTAPFYAVLVSPENTAGGAYSVAFSRVDGSSSCPELPRGDVGATFDAGPDDFVACFTVPADQHGARESFTWQRTAGSGDASLSVFTEAGVRYCGPTSQSVNRTVTCHLPDGPLTVFLEADGVDASYRLTHREPSA
ncbi:hypothetical protein HCA58_18610 [Micromonospora sp. HNM0581]|uniref:hypothetical protein n=1 Tax=Micromonospora sp. HNM0581 TaxID=2716341 RepID=UPI001469AFAB|nr:hypothetical protein [Micromonospora sp. HNM0581]NLU80351.1 hypothetical protein [Micromonospora sp. HNM0581]